MDVLDAYLINAESVMIMEGFTKDIIALHVQCIIPLIATVPDAILVFHIILKLVALIITLIIIES
jgi:hypothetical protein